MKRAAIALALACLGPALLAGCANGPKAAAIRPAEKRPNIIVIMADDLGYADISTYAKGRIPTPNIDRLGREGAVFTQGYVTAPICSPSRAGLMTGRYQQRFGFEFNNGPDVRDIAQHLGLDVKERTLPEVLRAGGYRTGGFGKWHLGSNMEHYPTNRGFDEWWGFLTGQSNYLDPDAPDTVNAVPPPKAGEAMRDIGQPYSPLKPENAVVTGPGKTLVDTKGEFLTEAITRQAMGFIDRSRGGPFFLYVGYNAPHTPLQAPRRYYDRFPQIQDRNARVYAAMVSALDDNVGVLLDHLKARGLAEDTIVIFLSDNGCAAYVPGICSSEPLAGGKLTQLEGGIRVPFMMRWPGHIPARTVYERPVSSLDIFPTAVSAARLSLPTDRPYDGIDLLTQVGRKDPAWQRPALFWRSLPVRSVREGGWKYYRDYDGQEHLFDIGADPGEKTDLADREPQRVAAMRGDVAGWEADKVPPAWSGRFMQYEFGGRRFKFNP